MSARMDTFAETLVEAVQAKGWRKVLVGLNPEGLVVLDHLITSQLGRGGDATAEQTAALTAMAGERRVVILIEPAGKRGTR